MAAITVHRQTERVDVRDDDGEVALTLELRTDDRSLERMLAETKEALDAYEKEVPGDLDDAGEAGVQAAARLQRRCITSIAGERGYQDILEYIGDGEPCDPADNLNNVGEVWSALLMWLYDRMARSGLTEGADYFNAQLRRNKARQPRGKRNR
jgi:hypothetical protein